MTCPLVGDYRPRTGSAEISTLRTGSLVPLTPWREDDGCWPWGTPSSTKSCIPLSFNCSTIHLIIHLWLCAHRVQQAQCRNSRDKYEWRLIWPPRSFLLRVEYRFGDSTTKVYIKLICAILCSYSVCNERIIYIWVRRAWWALWVYRGEWLWPKTWKMTCPLFGGNGQRRCNTPLGGIRSNWTFGVTRL